MENIWGFSSFFFNVQLLKRELLKIIKLFRLNDSVCAVLLRRQTTLSRNQSHLFVCVWKIV